MEQRHNLYPAPAGFPLPDSSNRLAQPLCSLLGDIHNTLETVFCVSALQSTLTSGKPEIFNNDQGAQYTREMKLNKVADIMERGAEEIFSYYEYPPERWRSLKTNNPLERINREIRRRTRVVENFPGGNSALMLVAARLRQREASIAPEAREWT